MRIHFALPSTRRRGFDTHECCHKMLGWHARCPGRRLTVVSQRLLTHCRPSPARRHTKQSGNVLTLARVLTSVWERDWDQEPHR